MEVIARRKEIVIVNGVLLIVFGLTLVGLGVWQGSSGNVVLFYLPIIVGCGSVALGSYQTAVFFATPKIVISYKDGVLSLPKNLNCFPSDIEDIRALTVKRYGVDAGYGTLTLAVKGVLLRYKNVEDVEKVKKRLDELKADKKDK